MDLSNAFTEATTRNALRREAGLPPLDIREEIEKARYQQALDAYHDGFHQHKDELRRIAAELREQGETNPQVISYKALELYKAWLAERGFKRPPPRLKIVYGESKS